MYANLKAEMARTGFNCKTLAEKTGIIYGTLLDKMRGESDFKFWECIAIKKALNSTLPLEELFLRS